MIIVKDLKKRYNDFAVLHGINLNISKGDIYGLVGRSGAGKSTLLRCINGLESYDEGKLIVNGMEMSSYNREGLREARKEIGMIFQNFSLLERKTVYDNVALPMVCWKYPNSEIDKRVNELLELVGILDKRNKRPRNLSGGQKQRVAIARALALNPKILLCDEATSALDPKTTKSILALLREINEKLGITIIIVTHQIEVVKQICNKACILENGKIVEEGSVEEIFFRQSPAMKRFLGEEEEINYSIGKSIQIFISEDLNNNAIFTQMALDLNITFSIVGGRMERYGNKNLGFFVISLKDDQYPRVIKYLDSKSIVWRDMMTNIDFIGKKGELKCEI
ncbi:methionine ABC transporter ATP-binding protein [Tissierella sp. DSM 105185]|uniref:Methionine ABC transporter ATP-binding protein n=1 Tax=Tissierella pigra TaxID=2607614 RepID=A0A6N7XYV2_9FIRM|nr:methionine ABC transporter ATP-binding protein [Tissierella pigra]